MNKKFLALTLALIMLAGLCLSGCGGSGALTLNVYNWGEYISDGSEGSFDTIREFEDWYQQTYGQKVNVNYTTYASNEDMYNKISHGSVSYDVIIPSDYMIARMAQEGLLQPLNFENIPNYQYIDESFKGLYYDPENQYSVPYAYGIVGIIYDANVVDKADVGGWDLMWNEKYSGSILQYNNSRDAFGTAMYKLGLDVNSTDRAVWDAAYEELLHQKPLVGSYVMDEIFNRDAFGTAMYKLGLDVNSTDRAVWDAAYEELLHQKPLVGSYVMDEIFNMMESGEASIGSYYAGDYFTMRDAQAENVDLQFYYPDKTNFYVDAMCIPSCAQNKELAEIFINYMLSEDAAVANAEFTSYASPNSIVYNSPDYIESMGEDAIAILYPKLENFATSYNTFAYRNMDNEMLDYLNTLWENLKIN